MVNKEIYGDVYDYDYDSGNFGEQRIHQNLPTVFCRRIAKMVGLMEIEEKGKLFARQLQTFAEFQQLSIACDLSICVSTVFYGVNLNDVQLDGLSVIHQTTAPWIKGHMIGMMLERMDDKFISNKDYANSMIAILEALQATNHGNPAEKTKIGKRLLLKLTTEPINQSEQVN